MPKTELPCQSALSLSIFDSFPLIAKANPHPEVGLLTSFMNWGIAYVLELIQVGIQMRNIESSHKPAFCVTPWIIHTLGYTLVPKWVADYWHIAKLTSTKEYR